MSHFWNQNDEQSFLKITFPILWIAQIVQHNAKNPFLLIITCILKCFSKITFTGTLKKAISD